MSSDVSISKFLSLVLRHDPKRIGLQLDGNGWADIEAFLAAAGRNGRVITRERLDRIVADSDKQRFAISEDGTKIRANQGHSVDVELGLAELEPPAELYHGTARRNLDSILREGLIKGKRHHVHLSAERETAIAVGRRHGEPVVLTIDAAKMHEDGFGFYRSANGVWLVDSVPPSYLLI